MVEPTQKWFEQSINQDVVGVSLCEAEISSVGTMPERNGLLAPHVSGGGTVRNARPYPRVSESLLSSHAPHIVIGPKPVEKCEFGNLESLLFEHGS
jgi:hypothetical protein